MLVYKFYDHISMFELVAHYDGYTIMLFFIM